MNKKVGSILVCAVSLGLFFQVSASGTAFADSSPGNPAKGRKIYKSFCAGCHGVHGDGKGKAGGVAFPPPANFTDPAFWKKHSKKFYLNVITNGYKDMPPWWDVITPGQIRDVFAYIRTFSPEAGSR